MKNLTSLLLGSILIIISSCHKTYTCKCSYPGSTATYSTGQVKAITAKKAEKRCSGTCQGGTISVK